MSILERFFIYRSCNKNGITSRLCTCDMFIFGGNFKCSGALTLRVYSFGIHIRDFLLAYNVVYVYFF